MSKRVVAAFAAFVVLAGPAATVVVSQSRNSGHARRGVASFRPKEAVHERPSAGHDSESEAASSFEVDNRAYPRDYVESDRALAARRAFTARPSRLGTADF